jgi:hypothetical protein
MRKSLLILFTVFVIIVVSSCEENTTEPLSQSEGDVSTLHKKGNGDIAAAIQKDMDAVNAELESQGSDLRILTAEYITNGDDGEAGNTVLSKVVGNKQLDSDFIPFDPRRAGWSGPVNGNQDDITYAVDQIDAMPIFGGLSGAQTTAAIDRAMSTWDNVKSTNLPITKNPDGGIDMGYTAAFFGLGGSFAVVADVMHSGFTDLNFAGGVLGVTYTWGWLGDADNDGKFDVAFRDIYYDPTWSWADDGVSNIDVESVALHEAGHGLSQGHFGTVRLKNDGSLKASPRAVMNALYTGPYRALAGTDKGGHSSNWGSWPNN